MSLHSKDRQSLRKFIPLTTLPEFVFSQLCAQVRVEEANKGGVLFKQGDLTNEFVYLLEGTVSLQAGGMEMDTVSGGSEGARFALAHQIPRKVFAVAKDKVRFVRVNAQLLSATAPKSGDTVDYEVIDMPEEDSGDWMTTLLKSPIFQRLPATNLQKVLTGLEEIQVSEGEAILKQGDPGDFYYIIKQGRCSLTRKPSPTAKEIKLAELKTTETFGEDSLISGSPRNVNVSMLTDGVLLRLSKENFLELVKKPVIQTVSFQQAMAEYEKGGILLDVRSVDEYELAHIEGSRNIPFFSLRMQLNTLDPGKRLVVICEDGNTSEAATFQLIRFGFDAIVLKGGFNGLSKKELAWGEQGGLNGFPDSTQESLDLAAAGSGGDFTSDEKRALEESRQIITQLQNQLQTERERRESTEKDHAAGGTREVLGANEREQKKRFEALSQELEKAKLEAKVTRDRLTQSESELAEVKKHSSREILKAQQLRAEQSARISTLEHELNTRQSELKSVAQQFSKDQQKIQSLSEMLREQEKQLDDLGEQVKEKSMKLDKEVSIKKVIEANLSRVQKESANQILKLTERSEQLLKAAQQAQQTIAQLQSRLDQVAEEKRRAESDVQNRFAQMQKELSGLEQQIALKNHDLEFKQAQQQQNEKLLRELQEKMLQVAASTAAEKQKLEDDLRIKETALAENQSIQEKLRQTLAGLQQDLTQSVRDSQNVHGELKSAEDARIRTAKELEAMRNELDFLKGQSSSFEQTIAKLTAEKEALASEKARIDQESSSAMSEARKKYTEVEDQCAQYQREVNDLRAKLEDADAKKVQLAGQLDVQKRDLEQALANQSSQTRTLDRELYNARAQVAELDTRFVELSATQEKNAAEHQALQREFDELSAKHQNTIQDHEQAQRLLREKIADLEGSLEQSTNALNHAIQSGQTSESDYSLAIQEIQRLKQTKSELESKLMEATKYVRQKDQEFAANQAASLELQQRFAQIQSQLDEVGRKYEDSRRATEQSGQERQGELDSLRRALSESTAQLERSRDNMNQLTAQRSELLQQVQKLTGETQRLKQDLMDFDRVGQQLDALQGASERQQEERIRVDHLHAQQLAQAQARQSTLEAQLARSNAEKSDLSARMASVLQDLKSQEAKLLDARNEYAALEQHLAQLKSGAADFDNDAPRVEELLFEIEHLKAKQRTESELKARALDEVALLHKEKTKLEFAIQQLGEHAESAGQDEQSAALKAELSMVREQADHDLKFLQDQLKQSKAKVETLEQDLKSERRLVAELQETGYKPPPLNPALVAVELDEFDELDEMVDIDPATRKRMSPSTRRQAADAPKPAAQPSVPKPGILKMIIACAISGILSLASAGGYFLGTQHGRAHLELLLEQDATSQALSHPGSAKAPAVLQ